MKEKSEDYKRAVYDVDNKKVLKYYKASDYLCLKQNEIFDKCFIFCDSQEWSVMNEKCEKIMKLSPYYKVKGHFIFYETDEKHKIVTTNGQILPSEYSYKECEYSDKYLILEDNKKQMGAIDDNAKIILEPSNYDKIDAFGNSLVAKRNDDYAVYQDSNKVYQTHSKRVIANSIYIIDFVTKDKANIIDIKSKEVIQADVPFDKILLGEDFIIRDFENKRFFINKHKNNAYYDGVNLDDNISSYNEIIAINNYDGDDRIINYYGEECFIKEWILHLGKVDDEMYKNVYFYEYHIIDDFYHPNKDRIILKEYYSANENKIYDDLDEIPLYQ